jgi:glycosyltransferase involved in cell wall biosynthesis
MTGESTAVGHNVEYLTRQWSRMRIPFDRIVLMNNRPMRLENLGDVTPVEYRVFGGGRPNLWWEQISLPRAARGAAVLLSVYNAPLFHRGPMVVDNHGIYEASLKKTFSWWQRIRSMPLNKASLRRADRIIANSLSTRSDLVEYWKIPPAKIDVVYTVAADLFFEPKDPAAVDREVATTFGSRLPYVIFVGKLSRRRNVPNLIEAFAAAKRQFNLPHHLLIAGPNTSNLPMAEMIERHNAGSWIHYIPYVEQSRLALLYAGADLFVLPSTYEGISLTIFEAMASGAPVLAVQHKALEEGGGDAVMALATASTSDLTQGLGRMLTDPPLRAEYREKGLRQVQKFSMRHRAEAVMAVLDKTAAPYDSRGGHC